MSYIRVLHCTLCVRHKAVDYSSKYVLLKVQVCILPTFVI